MTPSPHADRRRRPALLGRLPCLLALCASAAAFAADPPPTVITSDSGEARSTDTETTSLFQGHVVVTGNDIRIECDRLEVISARSGDKSDTIGTQSSFKYILATGHVHIVQGVREASCGRAEVLPQENRITLTGSPVVTDRGNGTVFTGEPLVLYRNQRRVTGEHVRITAPPVKDLGLRQNEPPPPPPGNPSPAVPEAPSPPSSLRTENLVKTYGRAWSSTASTCDIEAGEVVGLLGPNGAGKTTIFYMIVGPVPATPGRVLLDSHDITRLRMHKRARLGSATCPRSPRSSASSRSTENILAIVEVIGVPRRERAARVRHHLDELGPRHVASRKPTRSPVASAGAWRSPARWSPGRSSS